MYFRNERMIVRSRKGVIVEFYHSAFRVRGAWTAFSRLRVFSVLKTRKFTLRNENAGSVAGSVESSREIIAGVLDNAPRTTDHN